MPQYERLIANNDLYNPHEYGKARAGTEFSCRSDVAEKLVKQGSARRPDSSPSVIYETKVIYPEAPEVSARDPFRDVPGLNPQPPAVAPESDPVLPVADIQEPGAADRGKRAGRTKPDSGK